MKEEQNVWAHDEVPDRASSGVTYDHQPILQKFQREFVPIETQGETRRKFLAAFVSSLPLLPIGKLLVDDARAAWEATDAAEAAIEKKLEVIAHDIVSEGQLHQDDPLSYVYLREKREHGFRSERHLMLQMASIESHGFRVLRQKLLDHGIVVENVISTNSKKNFESHAQPDGTFIYVVNLPWVHAEIEKETGEELSSDFTKPESVRALLHRYRTTTVSDPDLHGRVHILQRPRGDVDRDWNNATDRMLGQKGVTSVYVHEFSQFHHAQNKHRIKPSSFASMTIPNPEQIANH